MVGDDWDAIQETFANSLGEGARFVSPGQPSDLVDEVEGDRGIRARLFRFEFSESDELMAWGSRVRYWLDIAMRPGTAPMDVKRLLAAVLDQVRGTTTDHDDRTVQVRWPTSDESTRLALAGSGFSPLLTVARRRSELAPAANESALRRFSAAKNTDRAAITGLVLGLHRDEVERGVFRMPKSAHRQFDAAVQRGIAEERILIVRSSQGDVEGCVELVRESPNSWLVGAVADEPAVILSNVCVAAGERRRGVASSLLDAAQMLSGSGTLLVFFSEANEPARSFWRRRDFAPLWTTWRTWI